jgi:hypothetical protein
VDGVWCRVQEGEPGKKDPRGSAVCDFVCGDALELKWDRASILEPAHAFLDQVDLHDVSPCRAGKRNLDLDLAGGVRSDRDR